MTDRPPIIDDLLNHVAERLENPALEYEEDVIEAMTALRGLPNRQFENMSFKGTVVAALLDRIARLEDGKA